MLSLAAITPANAATRDLAFQANATGACQSALPAFEGLIRKRPLALQNEGTTTAFVTCSPVGLQNMETGAFRHGLYLVNIGTATASVTCSAVVEGGSTTSATALPESVNVPAGGVAYLYWKAVDGIPADNYGTFNTSCALPPGVGITTVYVNQILDVGT